MQIGAWDFTPGAAFTVPGKVRLMKAGGDAHLVRVWRCGKLGKEVSADDCRACFGHGRLGRPICKRENATDPVGLSVMVVVRTDLVSRMVWFEDGAALPLGFLVGMAKMGGLKKVERTPAEALTEKELNVEAGAVRRAAIEESVCSAAAMESGLNAEAVSQAAIDVATDVLEGGTTP